MIITALHDGKELCLGTTFSAKGTAFRPNDVIAFTNFFDEIVEGEVVSVGGAFMTVRVDGVVFECRRETDVKSVIPGRSTWVIYGIEGHTRP